MCEYLAGKTSTDGHIFGHCSEDDDGKREGVVPLDTDVYDLTPQQLGRLGEQVAMAYLKSLGWYIAERNWVCVCGEADLICFDGDVCVLVEVKTRLTSNMQDSIAPELAVTPAKQKRYRGIAECYRSYARPSLVRFDVIAVSVVADGTAHLRHYEAAFGSEL